MPHKTPEARAAWYRDYYARNSQRINAQKKAQPSRVNAPEYQRRYRADNRGAVAALGRKSRLRKTEKAAGRPKPETCEVCGGEGRICFDHDHQTGAFRGWLCTACNSTLGLAKDDPALLLKLAAYLEQHS